MDENTINPLASIIFPANNPWHMGVCNSHLHLREEAAARGYRGVVKVFLLVFLLCFLGYIHASHAVSRVGSITGP